MCWNEGQTGLGYKGPAAGPALHGEQGCEHPAVLWGLSHLAGAPPTPFHHRWGASVPPSTLRSPRGSGSEQEPGAEGKQSMQPGTDAGTSQLSCQPLTNQNTMLG